MRLAVAVLAVVVAGALAAPDHRDRAASGWTAYAPLSDGGRQIYMYAEDAVVAPPGAVPADTPLVVPASHTEVQVIR